MFSLENPLISIHKAADASNRTKSYPSSHPTLGQKANNCISQKCQTISLQSRFDNRTSYLAQCEDKSFMDVIMALHLLGARRWISSLSKHRLLSDFLNVSKATCLRRFAKSIPVRKDSISFRVSSITQVPSF